MPHNWASELEILQGLVGDIARWIDSTLTYSQPGISIAISLSFVAALKSKRIAPFQGVAPNLYTCAIAPSGSGKSQAQAAMASIIKKAKLESLMMGKPGSDSGLLKSLIDNPRKFLVWDEFGIALSELANSKNSYRALILSTIMDLFSSAKSIYLGKELKTEKRTDIEQPHLSIFAASTPGRFFDSLSVNFIEDGFFPRWLIFFSESSDVEKEPHDINDIPKDILDRIASLETGAPITEGGNLERVIKKKLKVLQLEDSAALKRKKQETKLFSETKHEFERVLWSRMFEQAMKLCIVLTDGDIVDWKTLANSYRIVRNVISETIEKCSMHLLESSSSHERDKIKARIKFCDLIKPGEVIEKRLLAQRAHRLGLSVQERAALVKEQIENGNWETEERFINEFQKPRHYLKLAEERK